MPYNNPRTGNRVAVRKNLTSDSGIGQRSGRSEEFPAGADEPFFQFIKNRMVDRTAGHQQDILTGRHQFLVPPKRLAQAALGAVAGHGVAHGRPGGDDTEPGGQKG